MAAKRKTKKKAATKRPKPAKATGKRGRPTQIAVGSVIERTFKGDTHKVQVTAEGFTYKGKPYASLTAIARTITGYKAVSGPRFFGTDGGAA